MKQVYPWWYYFSWWFFIWVVLFLLGAMPYSPYMLALGILIYTIIKIGTEAYEYFFISKKPATMETRITLAIWLLLVVCIDVIPFFVLKPDYSMNSLYFTLFLMAIYLALMWYKKVDVIELYTFMRHKYLTEKYTPVSLVKAHFPFLNN